jgi:GTP-binding protein
MLLHLVDISEMGEGDPVENYEKINRELELYSPELIGKPQTVVGTKSDVAGNGERLDRLESYCKNNNRDYFTVSAATGTGIRRLLSYISVKMEEIWNGKKMKM